MISIIKKFASLMDAKQKKGFIVLFFQTLFGAFMEVISVSLIIPLVTSIMNPDIINTNRIIRNICLKLNIHSHTTFAISCIIAVIVLFIIKNVYMMLEYSQQARYVYDSRFKTQKMLLHALLNKPYDYYLNASTGEVLRVVNQDVDRAYFLLSKLMIVITETTVSVALVVTIFAIDPLITTFISIFMAVIIFIITKIIKPVMKKKGSDLRYYSSISYKWLVQSVEGIKDIKISQNEDFFEKNYCDSQIKTISALKWENALDAIPKLLVEMGCITSTLAIIAILLWVGRPVDELIPSLSAFAMAAVKIMPSSNRIINAVNAVYLHSPSLDNLIGTINSITSTNKTNNKNISKTSLTQSVGLDNITFHYPNSEQFILQNACMNIPIGKSVGIVGVSGAGKTTAIDILLGLLTPQSGIVYADGVNIRDDYEKWLSRIGYIPQSIFMMDDTIKSNVCFGSTLDEEKIWKALKNAQMDEFVMSLPDGLETKIGERGVRLSGGQIQRIGIARALYNDPEILVFDEATSALDSETESAIMESMDSLHGEKTLIIIAHRLQTIANCDMVYRVVDKQIILER